MILHGMLCRFLLSVMFVVLGTSIPWGVGTAEAASPIAVPQLKHKIQMKLCDGLRSAFLKIPISMKLPSFCKAAPPPPAVTVDIVIAPESIEVGEDAVLTWSSENADTCTASGGWSGAKSVAGSEPVSPTVSTSYTLTCTNAYGSASDTRTLTVTLPPLPEITFSATPESVVLGDASTLEWTTTDADSCSASDGWGGSRDTTGAEIVTPSETTTYTLTCSNEAGSDIKSVTVTLIPPPDVPTVILDAAPISIQQGSSTTLTWSSTSAETCTASDGWNGSKNPSGEEMVSPTTTTTYTLTCEGEGGSDYESVVVTVQISQPEPTLALSSDPQEVSEGGSAELTWVSTYADTCTASNGWAGTRPLLGDEIVTPTETTVYELTCVGAGGTAAASTTVTVTPEIPQLDHVVITEVYYDVGTGKGSEPAHEWIEIYNPTDSTVTLSNWTIGDATSTDILPGDIELLPNMYAVLSATTTLADFWTIPNEATVITLSSSIGNGLGNTGDAAILRNSSGDVVDALSWGDSDFVFTNPVAGVPAGYSLQRVPITVDTDTEIDWGESDSPTPGH